MSSARAPWTIALAALGAISALTLAFPIARSFSYVEINFNEGWNAYRQQRAAAGIPLYGAPPKFTVTNYPPLSFHIAGRLGKLVGDPNTAGRYISLISIALNAVLIGAIVRRYASVSAGIYAALTFLAWVAMFAPDRIGMNDPQMLATVFALAGLYAYVARPESGLWLAFSAVAFAFSVFTKHNLLAIPIAIGLHLLIHGRWKRFSTWTGAFALAAMLLLIFTIKLDGPYFFAHLTAPRTYSYREGLWKMGDFFASFQVAAGAAAIWMWCNARSAARQVLGISMVAAIALAAVFSGGHGVDNNIFFDAMILLAMILAIALWDLQNALGPKRTGLAGFALLLPLIAPAAEAMRQISAPTMGFSQLDAAEKDFQEAVQFVAARPGRAFCHNLLVCFEAGKPDEICMYYTPEQIKLGRLDEAEVIALVNTYRFQSIEIGLNRGELVRPEAYSERIMTAITGRYRVALRNEHYAVLVPSLE